MFVPTLILLFTRRVQIEMLLGNLEQKKVVLIFGMLLVDNVSNILKIHQWNFHI